MSRTVPASFDNVPVAFRQPAPTPEDANLCQEALGVALRAMPPPWHRVQEDAPLLIKALVDLEAYAATSDTAASSLALSWKKRSACRTVLRRHKRILGVCASSVNISLLLLWSLLLLTMKVSALEAEDVKSGVRFTIKVLPAGDKPVTKDQCLAAGKVLERRLAPRGRRDITITVEGEDTLQIQLSGMTPSELDQNRRSVESMGTLEFRAVAPPAIEALIEQREPTARVIRKGFEELPFLKALEPKEATPKAENPSAEAPKLDPEARAKQRREKFYTDKNTTMVRSESLLTGKSIRQAFAQASPGSKEFAISVTLTPEAGKQMKAISEEHLGQPLAIVVDKEVLSKPTIQGVFGEHFQITGWFSQKEATDLASALANPLQNPLKITQIAELKTAP